MKSKLAKWNYSPDESPVSIYNRHKDNPSRFGGPNFLTELSFVGGITEDKRPSFYGHNKSTFWRWRPLKIFVKSSCLYCRYKFRAIRTVAVSQKEGCWTSDIAMSQTKTVFIARRRTNKESDAPPTRPARLTLLLCKKTRRIFVSSKGVVLFIAGLLITRQTCTTHNFFL